MHASVGQSNNARATGQTVYLEIPFQFLEVINISEPG